MSESIRLAYLTSAFARPSDTFVRSEVDRLRTRGFQIETFSIRRPEVNQGDDPSVDRHQSTTHYILEAGFAQLMVAAILCAISNPIRFYQTKLLAWQTCSPGLRCLFLQLVYLMEAAYFARSIRKLRVTHIHNHIGENSATVAMLAASLTNVPYSLTIHGPAIFTAAQRWALGTKLDRAAFTACISWFCRSQCMLYAKRSTWPRLQVVRCAVGEEFLEEPIRIQPDRPTIVCVGRLCVEKAQTLLVEAIAQLIAEGHNCRVILVGDGPQRHALEALVERHKLHKVVQLLGWQSSERIRVLLSQASALALPSFAEGLPIVIMESMALECPVLSTNIAAIPELVQSDTNGWLVPPGDIDSLVAGLRQAITASPERLAELGRNARERVLNLHDPSHQADQLAKLFADTQMVSF